MHVALSKRNLLTLLVKLYQPESSRTLIKPDGTVIMAESDEVHYKGRKPGAMHPETERLMQKIETLVAEYASNRA